MFSKRTLALAALASGALVPSAALAFEIGYGRRKIAVPDWMDPYFVMLAIAMAVFYLAAQITKPRGVVLKDVDHAQMPFLPRFYYSVFLLCAVTGIVGVFFGGYLVHRDEFADKRQAEQLEVAVEVAQRLARSNQTKHPTLRFLNSDDIYELPAELVDMTHITDVQLSGTRVKDISILAQMPQLKSVDVSGTKVTDLSALSGLSGLVKVEARKTWVKDLSPLSGLTGLKEIDVGGSYVTDLTPIAGLTSLEVLKVTRTDVADISVLANHPSLRLVEIQWTKVKDLRAALTWPAMQPYLDNVEPDHAGVRFRKSAAAEGDPVLAAMTQGSPRARLGKLAAYYGVDWPIEVAKAD